MQEGLSCGGHLLLLPTQYPFSILFVMVILFPLGKPIYSQYLKNRAEPTSEVRESPVIIT